MVCQLSPWPSIRPAFGNSASNRCGIYKRMLRNIPASYQKLAQPVFTLLCCAQQPLTIDEIIDGVSIQVGYSPKDELKVQTRRRRCCPGGLSCIYRNRCQPGTHNATLHLAHFSDEEYLESDRIQRQHKDVSRFGVKIEKLILRWHVYA